MNVEITTTRESSKPWLWALFVFLLSLSPQGSLASDQGGFTGGVTPARFEIDGEAGSLVRRSIQIYNMGKRPAKFQVSTADWEYSPEGKLTFSQSLLADSCRPWVKLEAHEVDVVPDPRQPRAFRFEIHVPQDAKPQECRFALMVESAGSEYTTEFADAGIKLPVAGRIGVIVYLAIGGAEPNLVVDGMEVREVRGKRLPMVKVSNSGIAHGRLDGDLQGREKSGAVRPLSLATSPILPGQTRYMVLTPVENTEPLNYPLAIEGKIYTPNNTYAIDSVLADP